MPPNQLDPTTTPTNVPLIMTTPTHTLTPIQSFYNDTNIFITGGTGFLGKILIEKLLRTCPDIRSIYLLIRAKKGKNMHSRVADIFDDPIFERLHAEHPKFQHKIQTISGDCALPNLGISGSDLETMQREISIVFHVAATVRFDEHLRLATQINVQAPRDLMEMAKGMRHLKCFMHVSTAYANCPVYVIEEKFYDPPISCPKLTSLLDAFQDSDITKMTPMLLGRWPNTYAFTKAIAEDVVRNEGVDLPIGVYRPAIVISSYKEPIKGWIDNMYGPTGVSAAAANGIMRTLHCDPEAIANIVPVDMCVNALIVAAYNVSKNHYALLKQRKEKTEADIPVYNYVSSVENPIRWNRFMDLTYSHGKLYPSIRTIYFYSLRLNKSLFLHWVSLLFLHYLPAILLDTACLIVGKKASYLKMYNKIHVFMAVISYFATRTWVFTNENVQKLWSDLNQEDQDLFLFDMRQLEWNEFFKNYMKGIRIYLVKDPMTTLPAALKRWNRLYYIHMAVKTTFLGLLSWCVCSSVLSILS